MLSTCSESAPLVEASELSYEIRISPEASEMEAKLAHDYWALNGNGRHLHKVSHLANRYNVSNHEVTKIAKGISSIVSNTLGCNGCNSALEVTGRSSWDYFKDAHATGKWVCGDCIKVAKANEHIKIVEVLIRNASAALSKPLSYAELSVEQKIYLLAMYEQGAIHGVGREVSNFGYGLSLAWTPDMDERILKSLESAGVIVIHPASKGNIARNGGGKVIAEKASCEWMITVDRTSLEDENHHAYLYDLLKSEVYGFEFNLLNKHDIEALALKTVKQLLVDLVRNMTMYYLYFSTPYSYLSSTRLYPTLDRLTQDYSISAILYLFYEATKQIEDKGYQHQSDGVKETFFWETINESITAIQPQGWEPSELWDCELADAPKVTALGSVLLDNVLGLDDETMRFTLDELKVIK